jgi:hypothetical protein
VQRRRPAGQDPRTGALLGAGTSSLIGQVVIGTGSAANGMVQAGHGIADTGYVWPWLGWAPRLGVAYDPSGRQRVVLRGSLGVFFDRPDGNTMFNTVANPPVATGLTQQWGNLADLANSPVAFGPVPTVRVYYYNSKLPSDAQWNGGAQIALPWSSSIDVSYVGHHAYNVLGGQQAANPVDLNTIDLARPSRRRAGIPPVARHWRCRTIFCVRIAATATSRSSGASSIGPSTPFRPHSSGDCVTASRWASTGRTPERRGNTGLPAPQLRIDHHADGTYAVRPDQATAEAIFGDLRVLRHLVVANFVWTLPEINKGTRKIRRLAARIVNGFQLSGVFRLDSGAPYDVSYTYQTGGGASLTGSPD